MNTRIIRTLSFFIVFSLVMLLSFGLLATERTLAATTINVNSLAQEVTIAAPSGVANGNCTLGEAILAANTNTTVDNCVSGGGAPFTINLTVGTYQFSTSADATDGNNALPSIATTIIINGGGSTLNRNTSTSFRILRVAGGADVTLNNISLTNGRATGGGNAKHGGAIINLGTLSLTSVTISGSSANGGSARGGGIYNLGTLTGTSVSFSGNTNPSGYGGGLESDGTASLTGTSFSGNSAGLAGGGVYQGGGTLTLTSSSLSGNAPTNCSGTVNDGGGNTDSDGSCAFASTISSISINSPTVAENGGSGAFDVTLSPANAGTVTVNYTFNNGTATNGSDFSGTNGTLTFVAGDTSESIPFTLIDDALGEGNETFTVTLSGNTGSSSIGTGTGTATINDNEGAPTLNINSVTVGEGAGSGVFDVTLSPASANMVTVSYTFGDITANNGADYSGTNNSLTFNAGETSKSIPFSVLQDALTEGTETFSVTLSGATGGATIGTGTGTGTITDDEGGLSLNINSVTVNEGDGTGSFTVTLSAAAGTNVTVDYTFSDGSATAADYGGTNGTLTFIAGDTSKSIPFTLIDDALGEGAETFSVTLSNAVGGGATIGTGTGIATINDNEAVTGLSVDLPVVNETDGSGAFTVSLSPAAGGTVTVDYTITDNSATSGVDYSATMTGTLTFNIGDTVQTVPFTLIDDALTEGTEKFNITLSNAVGAVIGVATGTTRIIDDESPAIVIGGGQPALPPPFIPPPPPPLPPCNVLDDEADAVFRINVINANNNLESCKLPVKDGKGDYGAIGIQSVIDNGVFHALDVYGVDVSGGATIEVCLMGQGGMVYLDARQMPRTPQWMPTYAKDNFTCTILPFDGIVVLTVNNGYSGPGIVPPSSDGAAANSTTTTSVVETGTPLSDCRVTTLNMVNIRPIPSTEGNTPIKMVPYDLLLTATARTSDWFMVIFEDFQGWIHKDFLTTHGSCG